MNRLLNRLTIRLLTFAAALALFTGCDDSKTPTEPPPAEGQGPDAPEPAVPGAFLSVSAEARSCEVMLVDPDGQLGAPIFDAAVEGRSLRRGDRLAVAFAHRADAPIAAGAIGLVAADGAGGVDVASATCFDASGRPLADSGVALEAI